MDDPVIGLVIVDQLNDGKGMRQLSDGWMNREPGFTWRLRGVIARVLVALAAWLAPEIRALSEPPLPAIPT